MRTSLGQLWSCLHIVDGGGGSAYSYYLRNEAHRIAGWSSLVARRAHNPKVVGSNPAPATINLQSDQRKRWSDFSFNFIIYPANPLCGPIVVPPVNLEHTGLLRLAHVVSNEKGTVADRFHLRYRDTPRPAWGSGRARPKSLPQSEPGCASERAPSAACGALLSVCPTTC